MVVRVLKFPVFPNFPNFEGISHPGKSRDIPHGKSRAVNILPTLIFTEISYKQTAIRGLHDAGMPSLSLESTNGNFSTIILPMDLMWLVRSSFYLRRLSQISFSHIPLLKRSKNPHICCLFANSYPALLALLSHTASSVAYVG